MTGRCHRLAHLEAAMAMLRPGEPEILLWRYGEGLGCAEIAARLEFRCGPPNENWPLPGSD